MNDHELVGPASPVRDPAPPEFPSDAADRAFWERLDAFFADWSGTERQVLNEALVAAFRAERGMEALHLSASLEDLLLDYGRAEWSCGNRHTRADHPDGHCPPITDALNAVRAAMRGVRDPSPPEPSEEAERAAIDSFAGRKTVPNWVPHDVIDALKAAYAVDFGVRGAGVVEPQDCGLDRQHGPHRFVRPVGHWCPNGDRVRPYSFSVCSMCMGKDAVQIVQPRGLSSAAAPPETP